MVIITEQSNPDTSHIDLMSSYEIAKAINHEDKKVALAVETQLEQIGEAIEAIARSFLNGGRLAYFGAGTSGRLGVLDASECWPTFGVEHDMVSGFIAGGDKALRYSIENAEDNPEFGKADLAAFNPHPGDVVVGLSASGNPQYVSAVLNGARQKGCITIGITCNLKAKLKEFSDIFICIPVGPEAVTGSSRMKAGTAQKMVLNMLSTGAMIRIGKTYKNYMVDVRMLNEKLMERGRRFVMEICGVGEEEAAKLLEQSGNCIKTACVMAVKKCGRKKAEELLTESGGILRKVIK